MCSAWGGRRNMGNRNVRSIRGNQMPPALRQSRGFSTGRSCLLSGRSCNTRVSAHFPHGLFSLLLVENQSHRGVFSRGATALLRRLLLCGTWYSAGPYFHLHYYSSSSKQHPHRLYWLCVVYVVCCVLLAQPPRCTRLRTLSVTGSVRIT